jgi:hypothetical protein
MRDPGRLAETIARLNSRAPVPDRNIADPESMLTEAGFIVWNSISIPSEASRAWKTGSNRSRRLFLATPGGSHESGAFSSSS